MIIDCMTETELRALHARKSVELTELLSELELAEDEYADAVYEGNDDEYLVNDILDLEFEADILEGELLQLEKAIWGNK